MTAIVDEIVVAYAEGVYLWFEFDVTWLERCDGQHIPEVPNAENQLKRV